LVSKLKVSAKFIPKQRQRCSMLLWSNLTDRGQTLPSFICQRARLDGNLKRIVDEG
jgi:hypothetical protein